MNEIVYEFVLLTEITMILQCLQITFRQDLRFDRYMFGLIVVHLLLYMSINLNLLPKVFSVVMHMLLFVYARRMFRQSMKVTIVRFVIMMAMVSCIESVLFFLVFLIMGADTVILQNVISSILGLLVVFGIKKIVRMIEKKEILFKENGIFAVVIICGIMLGIIIINYYFNTNTINLHMVLMLLLVMIMFFCLYRLEQANGEIERKNYELEIQRVYGGTYEELLREVRRKQHDYKNQMGAIYSMHLVANSLEELMNMQKEYMDDLQSDSKYDSILIRCDNAILAGYLYYRCVTCQQEEIEVDYDIRIGQAKCRFATHEIIEILGILIDNACENFAMEQWNDKCIKLEFKEENEALKFAVANPAKHMSFSEISNMFTRGYSSKGENRGIGLARVQELVNQRKAELKAENVVYDKKNWLKFTITIEKK